ncbi:MAG: sigma 54-interacting transcriptional regulator [Halioglobus sp.]
MALEPDPDTTLPSVAANLVGRRDRSELLLTIIFHPDLERIGESAVLGPLSSKNGKKVLGRNWPQFSSNVPVSGMARARSCEDPYVSRQALSFERSGSSLTLGRPVNAGRVLVNGCELDTKITLCPDDLQQGVAILLASRVCLLLRKSVDASLEEEHQVPDFSSSILGNSRYMRRLRWRIARIAATDQDVLIRGETGTGKELVASAIHGNSLRAQSPLVTVNMSAVPVTLAPTALFGSAKGAFTGADSASKGYFEQARGGVLFLDEIGDTPLDIQAQLLRALQQREIQKVGGPVLNVELRVLAATDAALDNESEFKAALRHRLGSCELELRPLREHPEDIGELAWHYLRAAISQAGESHLLPSAASSRHDIAHWAELFNVLVLYRWPGNIRELANVASQIATASGAQLSVPEELRVRLFTRKSKLSAIFDGSLRRSIDVGDEEFLEAMANGFYEPTSAAKILKISRPAVYRRIEASPDLRLANQVPLQELKAAFESCDGDAGRTAMQLMVSRSGIVSRLRSAAQNDA